MFFSGSLEIFFWNHSRLWKEVILACSSHDLHSANCHLHRGEERQDEATQKSSLYSLSLSSYACLEVVLHGQTTFFSLSLGGGKKRVWSSLKSHTRLDTTRLIGQC